MLSIAIEFLFKGIGYTLFIFALWRLAGNSLYDNYIKTSIRKRRDKKRIKRIRRIQADVEQPRNVSRRNMLILHLEKLLGSVSKKVHVDVWSFIMISVIMFSVTSILLLILIEEPTFSLGVGLFSGLIPYLVVLYRLEIIRARTSLAFLNEFHVILQNYQGTNNVYYTLLNTIEDLNDKQMKRQFRKLVSSLQKERNDDDFRKNVHMLVFSINSAFAKRFGNLLLKAQLEGADITDSLHSLGNDIINRKKDMEEEKKDKMETIMVGFSPIFVLPMIIYFAYQLTGVIDFWHYFFFKSSLTLFILTIVCCVLSVAFTMLIRRPKADI